MAAAVKPIPDGMPTIIPHLIVRGADKALDFYAKAFGAKEIGRMPMPGPDGSTRIGHAEMRVGDSVLFFADEFPEWQSLSPQSIGGTPVTIHLYVEDVDAVYQRALDAGATAKMPPMNMFWGDRYGKVVDPFGHEWSLATHIEDVPMEELTARMMASMAQQAPCPE